MSLNPDSGPTWFTHSNLQPMKIHVLTMPGPQSLFQPWDLLPSTSRAQHVPKGEGVRQAHFPISPFDCLEEIFSPCSSRSSKRETASFLGPASNLLSSEFHTPSQFACVTFLLGKVGLCCRQMSVSSPELTHVDILTLKGDGVRRWGLWEGIRSWGWNPHGWD